MLPSPHMRPSSVTFFTDPLIGLFPAEGVSDLQREGSVFERTTTVHCGSIVPAITPPIVCRDLTTESNPVFLRFALQSVTFNADKPNKRRVIQFGIRRWNET